MPPGAGVTKNNRDAPKAGSYAICHKPYGIWPPLLGFFRRSHMRQKYIQRKRRLLMRAAPYLLAILIVPLIFTLRPHFGQTTFNYGDALQKAIWFFDANKCGPN